MDLNCPNTLRFKTDVRELAVTLSKRGKVGLVAAVWLLSKFGTQAQIMDLVRTFFSVWSIDEWVGRQVGALYPRISSNATMRTELLELIRVSRNGGAQATYFLHWRIRQGKVPTKSLYQYLKAMTPSQPRQITHQKLLLLITFMRSEADPKVKQNLAAVYRAAPLDAVEKYLLRSVL